MSWITILGSAIRKIISIRLLRMSTPDRWIIRLLHGRTRPWRLARNTYSARAGVIQIVPLSTIRWIYGKMLLPRIAISVIPNISIPLIWAIRWSLISLAWKRVSVRKELLWMWNTRWLPIWILTPIISTWCQTLRSLINWAWRNSFAWDIICVSSVRVSGIWILM